MIFLTLVKILILFWLVDILYLLIGVKILQNFNLLHIIDILAFDTTMWYI